MRLQPDVLPPEVWVHICSFLGPFHVWNYSCLYPFLSRDISLEVFHIASSKGRLDLLQCLRTTFSLSEDDARSENNLAFRWAAMNGHLAVIQWLTDTFHLTADDARSNNNDALRTSAIRGHFQVVQWLITHFSLTKEDLRSDGHVVFSWTAHYGRLDILEWIVDAFDLTVQDVCRDYVYRAFYCAAGCRHFPVLRWLTRTFQLTKDEQIRLCIQNHIERTSLQ